MPQTRSCDYCGDDIEPGTGTMFVAVNGTVTHFCSSKCEKNAELGRESRDLEWTEAGQAEHEAPHADARAEPEPAVEEPPDASPGGTEVSEGAVDAEGSPAPDLEAAEGDEDGDATEVAEGDAAEEEPETEVDGTGGESGGEEAVAADAADEDTEE